MTNEQKLLLIVKDLIKDKIQLVSRPGTYYGMHLFDSDGQILWGNKDNGEPCGASIWFAIKKKEGDYYKVIGLCEETGMEKYRIDLVK
jgi:hypothetical protein